VFRTAAPQAWRHHAEGPRASPVTRAAAARTVTSFTRRGKVALQLTCERTRTAAARAGRGSDCTVGAAFLATAAGGRYYFEVEVLEVGGDSELYVGFAGTSISPHCAGLGGDDCSWGVFWGGGKLHGCARGVGGGGGREWAADQLTLLSLSLATGGGMGEGGVPWQGSASTALALARRSPD
jgi:hypothetical protein